MIVDALVYHHVSVHSPAGICAWSVSNPYPKRNTHRIQDRLSAKIISTRKAVSSRTYRELRNTILISHITTSQEVIRINLSTASTSSSSRRGTTTTRERHGRRPTRGETSRPTGTNGDIGSTSTVGSARGSSAAAGRRAIPTTACALAGTAECGIFALGIGVPDLDEDVCCRLAGRHVEYANVEDKGGAVLVLSKILADVVVAEVVWSKVCERQNVLRSEKHTLWRVIREGRGWHWGVCLPSVTSGAVTQVWEND